MRDSVFATALLVLALVCGPAWAAGPATATYNWTGFYAGLNAGAAVNDSSYHLAAVTPASYPSAPFLPSYTDPADLRTSAFTGGGQLGYNYQVNCLVFGLEADFNYDGIDESDHVNHPLPSPPFLPGNYIHTVTQKVDFFGTFRGRTGYTFTDRLLLYATGGFAYGHVSSNSAVSFTASPDQYIGSASGFQTGWTVGGGAEYALNKCWRVKFEYLLVDLGSKTYTYPDQFHDGFGFTTALNATEHVFRLGVNYNF
jgi:outer membrane immunogenic protein